MHTQACKPKIHADGRGGKSILIGLSHLGQPNQSLPGPNSPGRTIRNNTGGITMRARTHAYSAHAHIYTHTQTHVGMTTKIQRVLSDLQPKSGGRYLTETPSVFFSDNDAHPFFEGREDNYFIFIFLLYYTHTHNIVYTCLCVLTRDGYCVCVYVYVRYTSTVLNACKGARCTETVTMAVGLGEGWRREGDTDEFRIIIISCTARETETATVCVCALGGVHIIMDIFIPTLCDGRRYTDVASFRTIYGREGGSVLAHTRVRRHRQRRRQSDRGETYKA